MDQVVEGLRNSGESYQNMGTICEQIARLDFQHEYPAPRYRVETGIAYAVSNQVIGELDVVIFDTQSRKALMMVEVKCWSDLRDALKKARSQIRRFQSYIQSNQKVELYSTKTHRYYDQEQFKEISAFLTLSQLGGKSEGFDRTLEFTLSETRELRDRMMDCQAQRQCR
jgi:hypothetical protein